MCADCPFAKSGPGLRLRKTLARGRWSEILASLRRDAHFTCHKTTEETGDGSERMCAGAIQWQENNHCVGQLQRIMERLDYFRGRRK